MLHRGEGTGLNLPCAIIYQNTYKKATIIKSIEAEQSTVNDLKRFYPGLLHNKIIQEFIKMKIVTFKVVVIIFKTMKNHHAR